MEITFPAGSVAVSPLPSWLCLLCFAGFSFLRCLRLVGLRTWFFHLLLLIFPPGELSSDIGCALTTPGSLSAAQTFLQTHIVKKPLPSSLPPSLPSFLPSFLSFLGQYWQHMEVPRLGVELELQPPATPQPQQCQIRAASATYTTVHSNAGSLTY